MPLEEFHNLSEDIIRLSEDECRVLSLGRDFVSFPVHLLDREVVVPMVVKYESDRRSVLVNRSVTLKAPPICGLFHARYNTALNSLLDKCNTYQWLILDADKNVGLCICTMAQYEDALKEHLEQFESAYDLALTAVDASVKRQEFALKWNALSTELTQGQGVGNIVMPRTGTDFRLMPARLRLMPKVHKIPLKYRPIVNASYCFITECDKALSMCLKAMRSIKRRPKQFEVWSTTQMIVQLCQKFDKLRRSLNEEERSFAIDIEAMYTSIDQEELTMRMMDMWDICMGIKPFIRSPFVVTRELWGQWLQLLLGSLVIQVGDEQFVRQKRGIPMGIASAPMLAVFYMSMVESKLSMIPRIYLRYVDDIFCWVSARQLGFFQQELLEATHGLHTKPDLSVLAPFLDTIPQCNVDTGLVSFLPYRKPMDRSLPPHWFSSVPMVWKRSILMGEVHRLAVVTKWYEQRAPEVPDFIRMIIPRWRKRGFPLDWIHGIIAATLQSKHFKLKMDLLHDMQGHDYADVERMLHTWLQKQPYQVPEVLYLTEFLPCDARLCKVVFRKWSGMSFGPMSSFHAACLWSDQELQHMLVQLDDAELQVQADLELQDLELDSLPWDEDSIV